MRIKITSLLSIFFTFSALYQIYGQEYTNPVVSGFHPDPSVCRVGEDYYLVNSSFAYFPGVPIFHSKDLINWKQIGYCLNKPSQLKLSRTGVSSGIWAPTLRYNQGKFYMVTTNMGNGGNFYVSASSPLGPWSEPIWIDKDGWDPSLFFDTDGQVYLTRNGRDANDRDGIVQYTIDLATGKHLSATQMIWKGTGNFGTEGPHIFKKDNYYYLLVAEGGTHAGHQISIARSTNIAGPYESCPRNPILYHQDQLWRRIQATGHGDMVQAHDGSWWMVFLGIRNYGSLMHMQHILGRETCLAPVVWDSEGWPIVGNNGKVDEQMKVPTLPLQPWPLAATKDNFDNETLGLNWNFLRNADSSVWSLKHKKGFLTLKGNNQTLDSMGMQAFVGRRQEHHACSVSTLLKYQPMDSQSEAGISVFAATNYHFDMGVTLVKGKRHLIVRRSIDDWQQIIFSKPIIDGDVTLQILTNPWAYQFFYKVGTSTLKKVHHAQSKLLSTEVTGGFVGNFFALYAHSLKPKSATIAHFDWFDYMPIEK